MVKSSTLFGMASLAALGIGSLDDVVHAEETNLSSRLARSSAPAAGTKEPNQPSRRSMTREYNISQENLTENYLWFGRSNDYGNVGAGQSFTVTRSSKLTNAEFYFTNPAFPEPNVQYSSPSDTIQCFLMDLDFRVIDYAQANSIPPRTEGWISFNFPNKPELEKGQYLIGLIMDTETRMSIAFNMDVFCCTINPSS